MSALELMIKSPTCCPVTKLSGVDLNDRVAREEESILEISGSTLSSLEQLANKTPNRVSRLKKRRYERMGIDLYWKIIKKYSINNAKIMYKLPIGQFTILLRRDNQCKIVHLLATKKAALNKATFLYFWKMRIISSRFL